MTPRTRRRIIPLIVLLVAVGLVAITIVFRSEQPPAGLPNAPDVPPAQARDASTPAASAGAPQRDDGASASGPPAVATDAVAGGAAVAVDPQRVETTLGDAELGTLSAAAPPAADVDPSWLVLGSLDPREATMQVELTPVGAGIARIALADQWETASAKHRADDHYEALAANAANPPPLPDESLRYVLTMAHDVGGAVVPVLAAQALAIDGRDVMLLADDDGPVAWTTTAPGTFEITVEDEGGRPVARVQRTFEVGDFNDLILRQTVDNLTDRTLEVKWKQWGPTDLEPDRARYMDRRRFRFGYLHSPQREPTRKLVLAEPKLMIERADIHKKFVKGEYRLWPNDVSLDRGYVLSWFASTNRYFALAVHPLLPDVDTSSRALTDVVEEVDHIASTADAATATLFTQLFSPPRTLPAGGRTSFDVGIYAGPQDRDIIGEEEPFASLGMEHLILYQMSSCCAVCTFQWLAELLIGFLSAVEYVVGDWGIAIIVLVCFVRLLLHPLTKRAQINMQRFSKSMTTMKPELEKLQKKYKDDAKKFQAEQIKLMREHGVSPLQFLGCLPMFLQTPIWIALYAMLYFAWEIRQEPAFYGVFQKISGNTWPFLADLSAADHCFGAFQEPVSFLFWNVTGINVLPILMGVIFFIQQKYMSPPPSPTMSKEQVQQQKIMKIMMVGMFPLMLYSAPSGLTLYILTSSCIGILESRYVRSHIDQLDSAPKSDAPVKKKSKSRDAMGRAYTAAIERAEAKRRARSQPTRSYKKRRR